MACANISLKELYLSYSSFACSVYEQFSRILDLLVFVLDFAIIRMSGWTAGKNTRDVDGENRSVVRNAENLRSVLFVM